MATIKTVLHPKKKANDIDYRLALRVTHNRKRSYYYLGYSVEPDQFDATYGCLKPNSHPKEKQINRFIRKVYDSAEDIILEAKSNRELLTASQIVDRIRGGGKSDLFFPMVDKYLGELEKLRRLNRWNSDKARFNIMRSYASETLCFHEIDVWKMTCDTNPP